MTHSRRGRLSAAQKADLWGRWKAGQSLHEIGRALGKDHVVVHFLLARHGPLRELVASKLVLDWSPKQISGWLKTQYPNDQSLRVSHETIYRSLFIQALGALKQELVKHLRSKRRIRRSRHSSIHRRSQGRIVDAISIRERPAEVEDRAIPGHWEGDLLIGARNSHVATLVERHSRFVMLVKVLPVPARQQSAIAPWRA